MSSLNRSAAAQQKPIARRLPCSTKCGHCSIPFDQATWCGYRAIATQKPMTARAGTGDGAEGASSKYRGSGASPEASWGDSLAQDGRPSHRNGGPVQAAAVIQVGSPLTAAAGTVVGLFAAERHPAVVLGLQNCSCPFAYEGPGAPASVVALTVGERRYRCSPSRCAGQRQVCSGRGSAIIGGPY